MKTKSKTNIGLHFLLVGLLLASASSCKIKQEKESVMNVTKKDFGITIDGNPVSLFLLKNNNGMEVEIIEYGAIVKSIKTLDKNNQLTDITLGYDTLSGYEQDSYYFGSTIGRVANRIGGASVIIEGEVYDLAKNTLPDFGPNHLHGGNKGFNKVLWKGEKFENEKEVGVKLFYLSEDGEERYPGNVSCEVIYSLNDDNQLKIDMKATTDQITLVNLTHHSYFNLSGEGSGTVLDQEVMINADKYTVADEDLIPTGEILEVDSLSVDFKMQRTVGSRLDEMQKTKFKGYDLNYVINHTEPGKLELAARADDPASGRIMEVYTTQPCMHFYTSNFLEGKPGKGGKQYNQYGAFCFEPQGYPDAPNKPAFESVELKPGETYNQVIIYQFTNK